jgi:hypothetical protein
MVAYRLGVLALPCYKTEMPKIIVSEGLRPSRQEKGNGLCGPGRAFSGSQGEVPR